MEKELEIIIDDNELGQLTGDEIDETIDNYQEATGKSYENTDRKE
jgi:hypothetical protein